MSTDTFLDQAWDLIGNAGALEKHYKEHAKSRADVALTLARSKVLDEETSGAIETEGSGELMAPLAIAACLAATAPRAVSGPLGSLYRMIPERAKPALREIATKCQKQAAELQAKAKTGRDSWDVRFWQQSEAMAAACLARLGDTKEAELLRPAHPWLLRALVPQGVAVDAAVASLDKVDDAEAPLREASLMLPVLARAGVTKAIPATIALLRSGIAVHALAALATFADPRGADAARTLLRQTGGDAWDVRVLTLAAQAVLWAHGERFPLDLARASVAWPIIRYRTNEPEALLLRTLAIDALRIGGNDEDRALARAQIRSPYRVVREAARKAYAKDNAPPKLTGWDKGRVAWAAENAPKELAAALDDPHAFLTHHVAEVLAKDAKAKPRVAAFVLARIEALPFHDDSFSELDADAKVLLAVAKSLAKGAGERAMFERSKSPWVRVKVLDEDAAAFTTDGARDVGPRKLTVSRFDAPADYFPGAVHLALARSAERVLVAGGAGSESFVFDPQTSERLLSLGRGDAGAGVTACAIRDDGSHYALARGPKVAVLDEAGSVVARAELPGVVTALAFSADGAALACGADSKALRIIDAKTGKETLAIEGPGACRGATWLGPKRVVFLADKGKKSALVDVDVAKKKHGEIAVAASEGLASHGRLLATWGGKKARLHDAKLGTKVEAECDGAIADLSVESDKALIAATPNALVRIRVGGKAPKVESVTRGTVRRLAAAGARIYGLADGKLFRFHKDEAGQAATGSHSSHVTGVAVLPGGRVVTTGWEGRVLLWMPEGGIADTLYDRKERVDSMAIAPDGRAVYFDDGKRLRSVNVGGDRETSCLVGGEDVEADLATHMPDVGAVAATTAQVAWGGAGAVHVVDLASGSEVATTDAVDPNVLAGDDAGNFYVGSDKGGVGCIAPDGSVRWARTEHGVDVLNGKLHGNPHRSVAALATRGHLLASLASDHTVRVYDGPTGERKLRWLRHVGIFNGVAISPNGELVAFTWGAVLEVVDIAAARTVALFDGGAQEGAVGLGGLFARPSLMALAWVDDATLVVGAENGALFRAVLEP